MYQLRYVLHFHLKLFRLICLHNLGTVSASIADIDFVRRRESIEQVLEDGTLSFLAIASIRHGFKIVDSLTKSAIVRCVNTAVVL